MTHLLSFYSRTFQKFHFGKTVLLAAVIFTCGAFPVTETHAETPVKISSEKLPAVLTLTVRRGPAGGEVVLHSDSPLTSSAEKGGKYSAQAEGFEVRGEIIPGTEGKLSEWTAEFHNTGKEQLLLEPSLQWNIQTFSADALYWDGTSNVRPVSELSETEMHDAIRRMGPWSAFADKDHAVMAGLNILDLRSYIATRWTKSENTASVEFVTRIVVEPGQTVPVHFLFGEFPVEYGLERELVQRLHDTQPVAFHPHPQAHPSLYGASSQYWSARLPVDRLPASAVLELLRRHHATWDWSYAPFKRTGDHWGHEDLWDYEPNIPFEKKRTGVVQNEFHFSDITREDFFNMRERHFNRNKGRDGLYFFSPGGVWVEKTLAYERYPDAVTIDENVRYELTQWVTGHDREVKVLPWFTSYEAVLKADWKRIIEAYDICGVALDVCRGGPRYRGPAIEKPIAVRAWDEKGIFIDQGVAIAKYIDFLHTLHPRHSPENVLAVRGNPETGGATYVTAARYDGGMFEGPPYHPNHRSLPLQRYLLGQKPLTWWSGWLYDRYAVPNYKNHDGEHFIKTMQGLADYTILVSFELGGVPPLTSQFGVPSITEITPDLIDALHLGWQAVFPVHFDFDAQHHTARYGKGLNTLLFYGNPHDKEESLTVKIDNKRLGDGESFIFAPWRGGEPELHNQLIPDATTKSDEQSRLATQITFLFTPREPILHRAVAAMHSPRELKVTTRAKRDVYKISVTLEFKETGEEPIQLSLPALKDWPLSQVLAHGKPIEYSQDGENFTLPALTPVDNQLQLEIEYHSPSLHLTRDEVKSFQLVSDTGRAVFDIVTSGPEAETEMAAEKLRQYAAFYAATALGRNNMDVAIQQEKGAEDPENNRIVLKVDPEAQKAGVWLSSPKLLLVQGRSAKELEKTLDHLLSAFDEFYPYTPGFRATWGMSFQVLKHAGMEGKILPSWKPESQQTNNNNPTE